MRNAIAFLAVLAMTATVHADSGARAAVVVEALAIADAQTEEQLIALVSKYDNDVARLEKQRAAVQRRLVSARHDIDFVLEDAITNQRARAHNEELLIKRVRKLLPAKQAAQLLVLIAATEPYRNDDTPVPRLADTPRVRFHDPDALFPPSSPTPSCDPFESMHGCRYWK